MDMGMEELLARVASIPPTVAVILRRDSRREYLDGRNFNGRKVRFDIWEAEICWPQEDTPGFNAAQPAGEPITQWWVGTKLSDNDDKLLYVVGADGETALEALSVALDAYEMLVTA